MDVLMKDFQEAQKLGWRYEYIHGNGVDGHLWVSPNGKCYTKLPANFRSIKQKEQNARTI